MSGLWPYVYIYTHTYAHVHTHVHMPTCVYGKRDLHAWQKRATYMAKETYMHAHMCMNGMRWKWPSTANRTHFIREHILWENTFYKIWTELGESGLLLQGLNACMLTCMLMYAYVCVCMLYVCICMSLGESGLLLQGPQRLGGRRGKDALDLSALAFSLVAGQRQSQAPIHVPVCSCVPDITSCYCRMCSLTIESVLLLQLRYMFRCAPVCLILLLVTVECVLLR